jgi:hypothetical protein
MSAVLFPSYSGWILPFLSPIQDYSSIGDFYFLRMSYTFQEVLRVLLIKQGTGLLFWN